MGFRLPDSNIIFPMEVKNNQIRIRITDDNIISLPTTLSDNIDEQCLNFDNYKCSLAVKQEKLLYIGYVLGSISVFNADNLLLRKKATFDIDKLYMRRVGIMRYPTGSRDVYVMDECPHILIPAGGNKILILAESLKYKTSRIPTSINPLGVVPKKDMIIIEDTKTREVLDYAEIGTWYTVPTPTAGIFID